MALSRRDFLRLSGMAGAGALLPRCGDDTHTNALIIGSGFGGAVAALRLAKAGISVIMLERGRRWPVTSTGDTFSKTFPADKRAMWLAETTNLPLGPTWDIEPYVGVLERVEHEGIAVYAGAGYGGGSLVYGCMTVQPLAEVFAQVFPTAIDYAEMDSVYYPRVRRMLGATPVPDDLYATEYFQAARVFREQAQNANLQTFLVDAATDWDILRREIEGTEVASAIDGDLIFGANSGYKNSLDRNYLKQAERQHAFRVFTQHQVRRVGADGKRYVVEADVIDSRGEVVETRTFTCDYLFMAAGSMGTTSLLMRAQAEGTLPNLNEHLGTGWGSNGNAMFFRKGLAANTGAHQALPPVTGILRPDGPLGPVLIEHAPYPAGYECNCLLALGCALTSGRGTFRWDAEAQRSILSYPESGNDEAVLAVRQTADELGAANGGYLSTEMHEGTEVTRGFTYHPLGGAVMGQVCDHFGRVKGHKRLYVIDSALIPGSTACANPSLTVAAIAERCMERILAEDF